MSADGRHSMRDLQMCVFGAEAANVEECLKIMSILCATVFLDGPFSAPFYVSLFNTDESTIYCK